MSPEDRSSLVDGYIGWFRWHLDSERVLRRAEETDWALDRLTDVLIENPALAWELICDIANRDQSEEVLDSLANGPLHSLLQSHAGLVLPAIEADALKSAHVADLLSYIWEDHGLPLQVWARVIALSGDDHENAV